MKLQYLSLILLLLILDIIDGSGEYSVYDEEPPVNFCPFYTTNFFNGYFQHDSRQKRENEKVIKVCEIHLLADHLIYQHIYNHEGGTNIVKTKLQIIKLFQIHVKKANNVYSNVDFHEAKVQFLIKKITIFDTGSCKNGNWKGYQFCGKTLLDTEFLELHSLNDYSKYCLSFVFTFRDLQDFEDKPVLGISYEAAKGRIGGVCEIFKKDETGNSKSFNVGVVTLKFNGKRVPLIQSQLAFTHELGHCLGSPHDAARCIPGPLDNNYIMFDGSQSGTNAINWKFSSCSISNISELLHDILLKDPHNPNYGLKGNCFKESELSFCGNQIKEIGEICDCGFYEFDCKQLGDACCIPAFTKNPIGGCQFIECASCSITAGSCCNGITCSIRPEFDLCESEKECTFAAYCKGDSAECPVPMQKPDSTPCEGGECQSGICEVSSNLLWWIGGGSVALLFAAIAILIYIYVVHPNPQQREPEQIEFVEQPQQRRQNPPQQRQIPDEHNSLNRQQMSQNAKYQFKKGPR